MTALIHFEQASYSLIWFALLGRDAYETQHKQGTSLEVEKLVQIPYSPCNPYDFVAEYRLENKGYYARLFETSTEHISYLILEDA